MKARVHLDFWGDVACPWCFIGHRRMSKVLEGADDVVVRYRAFQLQPQIPPEGIDPKGFFEKYFGSPERMKAIFARVQAAAAPDGIVLDQARQKIPNTRLAHRIIELAQREGQGAAAADALFQGQFEEGADLAKLDEALGLLGKHSVPLDPAKLREALAAGEGNAEVDADLALAARYGIRGVPFFLANEQIALEGAQPIEQLKSFLEYARREGQ